MKVVRELPAVRATGPTLRNLDPVGRQIQQRAERVLGAGRILGAAHHLEAVVLVSHRQRGLRLQEEVLLAPHVYRTGERGRVIVALVFVSVRSTDSDSDSDSLGSGVRVDGDGVARAQAHAFDCR